MPNPSEAPPRDERQHILALDGVRGIAILMVMLFHFQTETTAPNRLVKVIYAAFHMGQTGVDLFFVLSGFLISGILLDAKGGPHFFRNFYMRRTLRIFPLYYGSLILLNIYGYFRGDSLTNQSWLWFYGTNIALFKGILLPAGHFWSLAIEEHFYFLWPLLVYVSSRRGFAWICCGAIVFAMTTRGILGYYGLDTFYLTPCRIDGLAIGGLLAVFVRRFEIRRMVPYAVAGGIGLTILLVPVFIFKSGDGNLPLQTTKFTLLSLVYGALLTVAVGSRPDTLVGKFFANSWLRFFGKYSYGLYVFHGLLAVYFFERVFPIPTMTALTHSKILGTVISMSLALFFSVAAAWISWHVYEKHFLKLKSFFTR